MIIKLIFELYPEDGRIKPYRHPYSYIFRGVIMDWLNKIKPELVHKLHEYQEVRPYSINCKIESKVPKIDFILVSYDDILTDTLIEDVITNEKIKVRIGEKDYFIFKINFEKYNIREFIKQAKSIKSLSLQKLQKSKIFI